MSPNSLSGIKDVDAVLISKVLMSLGLKSNMTLSELVGHDSMSRLLLNNPAQPVQHLQLIFLGIKQSDIKI